MGSKSLIVDLALDVSCGIVLAIFSPSSFLSAVYVVRIIFPSLFTITIPWTDLCVFILLRVSSTSDY